MCGRVRSFIYKRKLQIDKKLVIKIGMKMIKELKVFYFCLKANTTSSGGKRHVFHPLARCGG